MSELLRNLSAGAKLACFRRVADSSLAASFSQVLALLVVAAILRLVGDFAVVGVEGEFAPTGLLGTSFSLLLALVLAWCFASLAGDGRRTLLLLTAILAILPTIELVELVLRRAFIIDLATPFARRLNAWLPLGSAAWLALAVAAASVRLAPLRRMRRIVGVIAAAAALVVPGPLFYDAYRTLWTQDWERETDATSRSPASEDAFYRQPELLERELAQLTPGRAGVVDLYFVGIAGYGAQDVFMREVRTVASLFSERFDTAGRSVTLINNPGTVMATPLASITALRRALRRIAAVMNADEDILFLFVTSHGSSEHRLAFELAPLQLDELDPARLKEVLDESGIQWRVVVVSACYSGGFLAPLADDRTLVISAAASDKSSFGCTHEANLTYFGRAYFDEALRTTHSFVAAFEAAKRAIVQRESAEGLPASEPQMHAGADILERLAVLERRLAARTAR
jgi:hypothetical protein